MPKPQLRKDYAGLEIDVIQTLIEGLHEWRPDLSYPESHSDMSGAVRKLMRYYEIIPRKTPLERLPREGEYIPVVINGKEARVTGIMTYEDIVDVAGGSSGVLYTIVYRNSKADNGTVIPGQEISVLPGCSIDCVFTGSA